MGKQQVTHMMPYHVIPCWEACCVLWGWTWYMTLQEGNSQPCWAPSPFSTLAPGAELEWTVGAVHMEWTSPSETVKWFVSAQSMACTAGPL